MVFRKQLVSLLMVLVMLISCVSVFAEEGTEALEDELLRQILGDDGEDGEPEAPAIPETEGDDIYLDLSGEDAGTTVYAHFSVPEGMQLYNLTDGTNATAINRDTDVTYEYLTSDAAMERLSDMTEDGVLRLSNGEEGTTCINIGNELEFEFVPAGETEDADEAGAILASDDEERDVTSWVSADGETAFAIINLPEISDGGWLLLSVNQTDEDENGSDRTEQLKALLNSETDRVLEQMTTTEIENDVEPEEEEDPELRASGDKSSMTIKAGSKSVKVTPKDVSHKNVSTSCKKLSVGSGSHYCCWSYATMEYKKIWGSSFSRNNKNNLLRNIPAAQRKLTTANLEYFFKNAKPGAMLRIDKDSVPTNGDNNGHSMIFLKKEGSGGWFWEGNYDGKGRVRIHYWSWSALVKQYSKYTYVKYIIYPGASALKPQDVKPSLSVASEKYPSGTLKKGKNFGLRGEYTAAGGLKITEVTAMILNSMMMPVSGCTFTCKVNGTYFKVNGTKGTNGKTLNDTFIFDKLPAGKYTFVISVKTSNSKYDYGVSKKFTVK